MADVTRAFAVGHQLTELTCTYPQPQQVLKAAAAGKRERAILARLWISEGIPFAFRRCPSLYEEVRDLLAKRLKIDAKQISMVGSARLGYSLAPAKWGDQYQPKSSDLDLVAVSEQLFEKLRVDYVRWHDDYVRGKARPRNSNERNYWEANRRETPNRIERGFIDSVRVPNWKRYGVFMTMNSCLADLWTKLQQANEGPKPRRRLTLRCYKDWMSYERQMTVSLRTVVDRNHSGIAQTE